MSKDDTQTRHNQVLMLFLAHLFVLAKTPALVHPGRAHSPFHVWYKTSLPSCFDAALMNTFLQEYNMKIIQSNIYGIFGNTVQVNRYLWVQYVIKCINNFKSLLSRCRRIIVDIAKYTKP